MSKLKHNIIKNWISPMHEKLTRYLYCSDEGVKIHNTTGTSKSFEDYKHLKTVVITRTMSYFNWHQVLKNIKDNNILFYGNNVGMDSIMDICEDNLSLLIDDALTNGTGHSQKKVSCFEYSVTVKDDKITTSVNYVPYSASYTVPIDTVVPVDFDTNKIFKK